MIDAVAPAADGVSIAFAGIFGSYNLGFQAVTSQAAAMLHDKFLSLLDSEAADDARTDMPHHAHAEGSATESVALYQTGAAQHHCCKLPGTSGNVPPAG